MPNKSPWAPWLILQMKCTICTWYKNNCQFSQFFRWCNLGQYVTRHKTVTMLTRDNSEHDAHVSCSEQWCWLVVLCNPADLLLLALDERLRRTSIHVCRTHCKCLTETQWTDTEWDWWAWQRWRHRRQDWINWHVCHEIIVSINADNHATASVMSRRYFWVDKYCSRTLRGCFRLNYVVQISSWYSACIYRSQTTQQTSSCIVHDQYVTNSLY